MRRRRALALGFGALVLIYTVVPLSKPRRVETTSDPQTLSPRLPPPPALPPPPPPSPALPSPPSSSGAIYLYTSQRGPFVQRQCTVPCFVRDQNQGNHHTVRSLNDSAFCVVRTMEVERIHSHQTCLTSSTSFESDFPMTYYTPTFRDIFTPVPGFDERIEAAVFVARNCHSNSHRENLVKQLGKHFRVDSPSRCLHNTDSGFDRDKVIGLHKYRVYLAFENSIVKDYATEKVYDGLESGAVPVYLGAPNIEDGFVPTGSIVNTVSFSSTASLAEYIKLLLRDKTAWDRHQEWRTLPPDTKFVARFNKTAIDVDCRICQAVNKRPQFRDTRRS